MNVTNLQFYLWFASFAAQLALVSVLITTKIRKTFPWFFLYQLTEVARTMILMGIFIPFATKAHYLSPLSPAYYVYFYAHLTLTIIIFGFQVSVLWEIWRHLELDKFSNANGFAILCCLCALFISIASLYRPDLYQHPLMTLRHTLERALQCLQCMMFIALIFLSRLLRLHWRHHVFNIAAIFAFLAGADLCLTAVHSILGPVAEDALAAIKPAIYITSLNLWIIGLFQKEPSPKPPTDADIALLKQIAQTLREHPLC